MYKIETLLNGLRIITREDKARESVALGFLVGVGGRFESDRLKGAAHFLEHIVFKGSKKYSCNKIKQSVEGVGGMLNAFTSEENTCFYAKIPAAHLEGTFDVLADMVFFPKIAKADTESEKTVIVEEIKMYQDLPQYHVVELLDRIMWPNNPLGKGLAGSTETVTQMSNLDLRGFHRAHYTPENIVVSVCGNLSHAKIMRLIKQKLGALKKNAKIGFEKIEEEQTAPRVIVEHRTIEQMHVALGMPGYDENNKKRFVLSLINVILGANMSSRLFVEVREKRGLAYSIGSSSKYLHDCGVFMVRAGIDSAKITEAVDVILKELDKMTQKQVSADEFRRAKDYLLGQLLLGLEDTMDHMLWMGDAIITRDKVYTRKQIVQEFSKITQADVKRVAKEIFNRSKYSLAIIGPVTKEQTKELNQIIGV